jgi:hypothetical protein
VISAILFVAEQLTGVFFVRVINISIELVQNNVTTYTVGVLVSKLFALFLVFILRSVMKDNKFETDKQFNFLMAFMPIQSIVLCILVYYNTISSDTQESTPLGAPAVILSLLLVFIIMFVLNNQRKAFIYKRDYEQAHLSLKMQFEQYQNLYQSQSELRSIRHDITNNLIAISGMLENGLVDDAINSIKAISSDVKRTADIIDTGIPAIDAVLNAKVARANESDIRIIYKIILENDLGIDQIDIAVIIASALDNAIEGILRSNDVAKSIFLNVKSGASDYIHIIVENFTTGTVNEDFQTTKSDKINHGFGIARMRSIAEKYNGDIQPSYDQHSGKFSLNVLLENRAK